MSGYYSFNIIEYYIDGVSLSFILLTSFIMTIVILITGESDWFLSLQLIIVEIALIFIFLVKDIFFFFIGFEVILIPMFIIIGLKGSKLRESQRIYAAMYFFIFTFFGSIFMLMSIIYLYISLGTTNIDLLCSLIENLPNQVKSYLWIGFSLSLLIKAPIWPLHIWLPLAHTEANLAGSLILAGILLKLSGYGFYRIVLPIFPDETVFFTPILYLIFMISIIYTCLSTLRQIDLKTIIAYSSIGHMAIALLGLFSNNVQGITGAILLMLAHGLASPGLFICIGILYDRFHSRNIKYYRGISLYMPIFSILLFLFILSNIGFPLTMNFIGEFLSFYGSFKFNSVIAIISSLGMILVMGYSFWMLNRILFGTQSPYFNSIPKDINLREFLALLFLIIPILILGVYPKALILLILN